MRFPLLADARRSAAVLRGALHGTTYDWTREMPRPKRIMTRVGILIQGFAIYAGFTRSLIWPLIWPRLAVLVPTVLLIYYIGYWLQNAMLTSEFIRKTQLESDQIAARQIQQALQPTRIEQPIGYDIETWYQPLRAVGGDYFDIISLPRDRTLFAVADVSGKGMAAALLSANIQALVRSLSAAHDDPAVLASQINLHLCRYTPANRFATAVFIVLDRNSGNLVYVNAGHNPPLLIHGNSHMFLETSGTALGWFADATYVVREAILPPGGALLTFTDGLPDSIPEIGGRGPETRIADALGGEQAKSVTTVRSLMDPSFNEDDVTVVLVKRHDA